MNFNRNTLKLRKLMLDDKINNKNIYTDLFRKINIVYFKDHSYDYNISLERINRKLDFIDNISVENKDIKDNNKKLINEILNDLEDKDIKNKINEIVVEESFISKILFKSFIAFLFLESKLSSNNVRRAFKKIRLFSKRKGKIHQLETIYKRYGNNITIKENRPKKNRTMGDILLEVEKEIESLGSRQVDFYESTLKISTDLVEGKMDMKGLYRYFSKIFKYSIPEEDFVKIKTKKMANFLLYSLFVEHVLGKEVPYFDYNISDMSKRILPKPFHFVISKIVDDVKEIPEELNVHEYFGDYRGFARMHEGRYYENALDISTKYTKRDLKDLISFVKKMESRSQSNKKTADKRKKEGISEDEKKLIDIGLKTTLGVFKIKKYIRFVRASLSSYVIITNFLSVRTGKIVKQLRKYFKKNTDKSYKL